MLTEQEITRTWRILFRETGVGDDTFARAELLLEELRPESPLRHRLEGELNEIRRMRTKKAAPKRTSAQKAKA